NYANLLQYEGRTQEAIPYYLSAIEIYDSLGEDYKKIQSLTNLASAYEKLGETERALAIFHDAIDTCKARGWPERLIYLYNQTSIAYKNIGEYKLAMDYFVRFHKVRDSIITESTKKDIAELEAVHQAAVQKSEIFEKDIELQKIKSQNLLLGLTLLFFVGLFLGYYYVKRNRS